ncbi:DUF1294 domain-containing protein [Vogesella sp. LIG4]|uniref:DUF1294 domain-containing protein n=1 Tax=Vogesella sp. LIG4 TaxID=1192162 RepID=UPI00138FB727|nr:DUF1294 domain-containing protein [Vogesella sp. LIG4]
MVTPNGGGEPALVHQPDFQRLHHPPRNGDLLSYNVSRDPQGRLNAHAIRQLSVRHRLSTRPALPVRRPRSSAVPLLLFAVLLAGAILLHYVPVGVAGLYLFFSLLTYVVYARDKRAAQLRRWRTRESTLHLLSLLGGWPGAWLAQRRLRHKSSKLAFQFWYRGSIAANLGLLVWLHSGVGG